MDRAPRPSFGSMPCAVTALGKEAAMEAGAREEEAAMGAGAGAREVVVTGVAMWAAAAPATPGVGEEDVVSWTAVAVAREAPAAKLTAAARRVVAVAVVAGVVAVRGAGLASDARTIRAPAH